VRPIVEYGSVIWNPYLIGDIDSIESIQRNYTKKICSRCNIPFSSYEDRLYKLSIRSLQYRRLEADLIMTFKILHNLVEVPMEQFFNLYSSPYNTRRHKYSLQQTKVSTDFQQSSFANRVVPTWNKLPAEIVSSTTLGMFRSKLRGFNLHQIAQLKF
jgi:hypothetical protein